MGWVAPRGIIAAPVLPLQQDGAVIDQDALAAECSRLAAAPGVTGLAVNAVASEGSQLTPAEAQDVVRLAVEAAGPDVPVVSGLREEWPTAALPRIEALAEAGARAVLVQAPPDFSRGGARDLGIATRYFTTLASAGVPLIVFQHQLTTGRAYPTDVLVELLSIEGVVGVKETTWDVWSYERDVRAIRADNPDARVYCGNDTLLLPCLATAPPDGLILGLAGLCPGPVAKLWDAVQAGDLAGARAINDRLYPLVAHLYSDPPIAWYARVKAALVAQGVLKDDAMRAPQQRLPDAERAPLERALSAAGLLG